jgi:hypothetical protein
MTRRRRFRLTAYAVLLLLLIGLGVASQVLPGGTERPLHASVVGHGSLVIGSKAQTPGDTPLVGGRHHGLSVVVMSRHLLYPGQAAPLDLVFSNRHGFDVRVVKLQVRTEGTGSCPARYYLLGSYELQRPVLVDGHGTAASQVPFGLRPSAPDGCQSTAVSVDVKATAVKR